MHVNIIVTCKFYKRRLKICPYSTTISCLNQRKIVYFFILGQMACFTDVWMQVAFGRVRRKSRMARISRILSHRLDAAVGWVERDITGNSTEKIIFNFTENLTLSKTE